MDIALSDPGRLRIVWAWAVAEVKARAPEIERRRRIDAELARTGVTARMVTASAAAASADFEERLGARTEERAAARDEADLARVCQAVLIEMGVDMTDLRVMLRRQTKDELRRAGFIGRRQRLSLRIAPTLDVAQAAIAAVDRA